MKNIDTTGQQTIGPLHIHRVLRHERIILVIAICMAERLRGLEAEVDKEQIESVYLRLIGAITLMQDSAPFLKSSSS